MTITLAEIWRYPVKGLRGERLGATTLTPEAAVPDDRRFALRPDESPYDPAAPCWQAKRAFLQLARDPGLSPVSAAWDGAAQVLTLTDLAGGRVSAAPDTVAGRARLEAYLAGTVPEGRRAGQRLVEAPGIIFSDTGRPWVSIISLATVAALAERAGRAGLDPARFRGNLIIAGAAAWAELGWIGRELVVGGAVLRAVEPIGRCVATTIDPATGASDVNLVKLLLDSYGHNKCGVYAEVITAGPIAEGNRLRPA